MEVDRGVSSLPYSQDSSGRYKTNEALENFLLSMRNNRDGRLQLQSEPVVSFPIFELPRVFCTLRSLVSQPPQPSQHHDQISVGVVSLHYSGPTNQLQYLLHQTIVSDFLDISCAYSSRFPKRVSTSKPRALHHNTQLAF